MAKKINFNSEARDQLKRGIDHLANAVSVTLGPMGRNVVIQKKYGSPHVTKDGVTVAKEIELPDPIENMGAQLLKEAASKTNDLAGDGTTTATVLARSMVNAGMKYVAAGSNPIDLKRGIDKSIDIVISNLIGQSELVGNDFDMISHIGTISANNDPEIGELISNAMKKVGTTGVITVEEAKGTDTTVDIVNGMQFNRGYLSPYFVTNNERLTCVYDSPLILLVDGRISSITDLVPILEQVVESRKPFLIVCEDMDPQTLSVLVVNRLKAGLKVVVVKSPGFGDKRRAMLEDIGILTGSTIVSEQVGIKLSDVNIDMLGTCSKVVVDKDNTTLSGGNLTTGEMAARIDHIKSEIERCESTYEREKLQERLAKLTGGIAVLRVGAPTEVEMKEKKDRVDDALHATRAAVEEGIVTGGGVALVRAIDSLQNIATVNEDEKLGVEIVKKALESPIRAIAENAGSESSVVFNRVLSGTGSFGFNARTGEYEDLKLAGVIDPTKVTRIALEKAGSVAGMILMTECVISELPVPSADNLSQMGMMGNPGGMM